MEEENSKRGVKTRLFGFILIVLGVLDSLLTLRGGIPAYEFLILIFAGICIFAIGAIRSTQPPSTKANQAKETIKYHN